MSVRRYATTIALACCTLAPLHAQTSTATIAGRILDPQGRPVAGATVTVRNTDLSSTRTATTDASGNFRVASLTSGAFTVEAKSESLATRHPVRLTLSLGSTVHVDVPLALPAVKQSATVHARSGLVEGNTVAPEVNKEDSSVGIFLAGLTVTYLPNRDRDFNQFTTLSPGADEDASGNGVIMAGQRASSLITQVDGTSFNDPLHGGIRGAGDRAFFLPQTVVREFQIIHSGVTAEVGGTNSGLINVVTKQGSGRTHGELFYTGRPSGLTAADAFGNSLDNTQNTFGGSTGGPLKLPFLRKRSFYYVGFEQDFLHVPYWSAFAPQAPGVVIPTALAAQQGETVQKSSPTAFFGRVDLLPSPKDTLALELGLNRVSASNVPDALNTGASTRSLATAANAASLGGHSATAIVQWMHLLTPRLVNQATVAWSGDHRSLTPNSTAPEQVINGFGILGGNSFGSQLFTSQQTQLKEDVSLTRGNTLLTFGGAFAYDPAYQQQEANLNGRFDYDSLADYLAANPRRFQQTFALGDTRYRGSVREFSLYGNGRFTLTRKLTLTAGLRWASQFNPQPQNPNPAIPVTAHIPSDLSLWQPRLGLAWNPATKTVVRLSSGLFSANTPADIFHRVAIDNGQQVAIADSYFDPMLLTLAQPLPRVPALTTPAALVIGIDPNFRNPTSAQFAATLEQELHPKLDVTVGYLHNSTWHLQRRIDENLDAPTIDASGNPVFPALRPSSAYGRLLVNQSNAHSNYDGLLVTAISQISRRTQVTANYTFARTRDDDSNDGPFSIDSALNPYNLKAEAAPSTQDVRHNLNIAAILNLPVGFKFNPIFITRSGLPYTPLVGFDTQHDANDYNDRAVISGQVAARNSLRQPAFNDLDLRIVKDFTLPGEGHHLDLFMDVFNVAGSGNRSFGPSSSSLFGNASSPVFSAGQALFAPDTTRLGGPREVQFTARLVGF
ncbi:TonB-dependent receptor [Granulicella sp. WH15]|uniref:TonB-dependent receptor n=1 Tax=Granulicella sp. WH15 TaxID=2602070 RepID=UPI001366C017|nr:carboxypeptidase regulatory-like domain-containing protein [Granulicella sp. WH15]QHN04339.1 TonB-dependent receptor [Granulicella sp. WH15]